MAVLCNQYLQLTDMVQNYNIVSSAGFDWVQAKSVEIYISQNESVDQ